MDSLFQLSSKPVAPQVTSSSRIEVSLLDDVVQNKTSASKKVQGIASSSGGSKSTQSKRDNLTIGSGRENGLTNKGNDCTEDDENASEDSENSNSNEKSTKKNAGLSFISNLKQSKMSKERDDTKRFGSLILVPMTQLSTIGYSSDDDFMDSSSSSNSSNGSNKKKGGRLMKKTAVSEPKADLISESICKKAAPENQTDNSIHTKKSTSLMNTKQFESKSNENEASSKNVPDESPKSTTKKSSEPEPASQLSGDAVSHVLNSSPTTRSRKALENLTRDPPEGNILQSDLERAPSARRVTAKDPPECNVVQSDLEATSSSTSNSSRSDGIWSPEEVSMMLACSHLILPCVY